MAPSTAFHEAVKEVPATELVVSPPGAFVKQSAEKPTSLPYPAPLLLTA